MQFANIKQTRTVMFWLATPAAPIWNGPSLLRDRLYVRAIIAKYKLPCRSYLLLLTEGGVPERFPRHLEFRYGDYEARVRLRVVRLWKIPARRILAMGRLALFPWTALMAVTPAELAEAWRRLVATGDRSLPDQMILLSGLRYGKRRYSRRFGRI